MSRRSRKPGVESRLHSAPAGRGRGRGRRGRPSARAPRGIPSEIPRKPAGYLPRRQRSPANLCDISRAARGPPQTRGTPPAPSEVFRKPVGHLSRRQRSSANLWDTSRAVRGLPQTCGTPPAPSEVLRKPVGHLSRRQRSPRKAAGHLGRRGRRSWRLRLDFRPEKLQPWKFMWMHPASGSTRISRQIWRSSRVRASKR